MLSKKEAMELLETCGVECSEHSYWKNGTYYDALMVGSGSVRMIIRENVYSDLDNPAMLDSVFQYLNYKNPISEINGDYIKEHVQLCIQKKSGDDIVKRSFLNLEEYLRVVIDKSASFKVTEEMLENYHLSADELFCIAEEHSLTTSYMIPIMDILQGMVNDVGIEVPMYVILNASKSYGACGIRRADIFKRIADEYDVRHVGIIPSSIHEILVFPVIDYDFLDFVSESIITINETEVSADDFLSDNLYMYDSETNEITIYK